MVTIRSRTLAHHTFKRAIRKVHRLNPPVLPSEESHAVSVHGIGTSCLCASMPYAAFPLHCHHSDGAGKQGLRYIPYPDALHTAPTGYWSGTGYRADIELLEGHFARCF